MKAKVRQGSVILVIRANRGRDDERTSQTFEAVLMSDMDSIPHNEIYRIYKFRWERNMKGKALLCAAMIASGLATAASASDLGVNYNGLTRNYQKSDVDRTGAKWVRAFVDVTRLYKQGVSTIGTDPDLMGLVKAHNDGFKIILNLKFDFTGSDFPSDANSQAFKDLRAFTTQLLDQVFPSVDIIVVGNEPFIESDPADRDNDLVLFYEHMANHVITYNRNSGRNIPLYTKVH